MNGAELYKMILDENENCIRIFDYERCKGCLFYDSCLLSDVGSDVEYYQMLNYAKQNHDVKEKEKPDDIELKETIFDDDIPF